MMLNLVIVVASVVWSVSAQPDKIVCYLGSWAVGRDGPGKVSIKDLDPNRCTHLNFGFAGLNNDGSLAVPDSDLYRQFNSLKEKNPNLKTLIALGGWTEGSADFSAVAADPNLRSTLAQNIVDFMDQYRFDGCDFDWEFPTQREGSSPNDKENLVELLRVVREKFDSTEKGYLLTAAVAVIPTEMEKFYNVPDFSRYLDFINLMAYDMHGAYDKVTGQNAPLYASRIDTTDHEKQRCADAGVQAWIDRGADPGKLVLGLASYGRSFTLTDRKNTQLGASAEVGNPGPYTKEGGILAYYEICELQNQGGWTVVWDDDQKVPYAFKDDQWVGYDTPDSIRIKVEYAKSHNLGGLMLWAIDLDDMHGTCGQQYPILSAVKETMGI